MPSLAPYVLRIPFKDGLKDQEVGFRYQPESLELINCLGGCCLYVNGKPHVQFLAETTEPGVRQVDES